MVSRNRVVWYEGMFLKPEHFEQDFRYSESATQNAITFFNDYCYGLKSLAYEKKLLEHGKFAVTEVSGVFRDGTVFQSPERDLLPLVFEINVESTGKCLCLTLPISGRNQGLVPQSKGSHEQSRYVSIETPENPSEIDKEIESASLNLTLYMEDTVPTDCLVIPIVKIQSVDELGVVTLDDNFIPTILNTKLSPVIIERQNQIHALMLQRVAMFSDQIGVVKRALGTNTLEFLHLQTINRYLLLWKQYLGQKEIHPYELFKLCLYIAGDLTVFTQEGSQIKPPDLSIYDHRNLEQSLLLVLSVIEAQLGGVIAMRAIHLELEEKKYGIQLARIDDNSLLNNSRVILAASSQIPSEQLRLRFPQQAKIAPAEKLTELVQLQLPGLGLSPVQVVPEEMPYYKDYVYFEVGQNSDLWHQMKHSVGFAIHPGAEYPSLALELWVIKQE